MTNVWSEVLMMLGGPMAFLVLRVQPFEFVQDAGSEPVVHEIVRVGAYDARPIHLHASPLPISEPKHLAIEVIRESLGPFGPFSLQEICRGSAGGLDGL